MTRHEGSGDGAARPMRSDRRRGHRRRPAHPRPLAHGGSTRRPRQTRSRCCSLRPRRAASAPGSAGADAGTLHGRMETVLCPSPPLCRSRAGFGRGARRTREPWLVQATPARRVSCCAMPRGRPILGASCAPWSRPGASSGAQWWPPDLPCRCPPLERTERRRQGSGSSRPAVSAPGPSRQGPARARRPLVRPALGEGSYPAQPAASRGLTLVLRASAEGRHGPPCGPGQKRATMRDRPWAARGTGRAPSAPPFVRPTHPRSRHRAPPLPAPLPPLTVEPASPAEHGGRAPCPRPWPMRSPGRPRPVGQSGGGAPLPLPRYRWNGHTRGPPRSGRLRGKPPRAPASGSPSMPPGRHQGLLTRLTGQGKPAEPVSPSP